MQLRRNHLREILERHFPSARQGLLTKYGAHALAVAFTCTLYFWSYGGNFNQVWMQRWFILMLGACLVIAASVGKRTSWLFAPATFFTLFSGLVTSFWFTRYGNAEMELIATGISNPTWFDADAKWTMQAVMRQDASRAIFVFVALMAAQRILTIRAASVFRTTLGALGLVQAVIVLAQWSRSSFWTPYFDNPSTCGAFLAICYWVLHGDINEYLRGRYRDAAHTFCGALLLAAILVIKATTPLLAMAGGTCAYFLAKTIARRRIDAGRVFIAVGGVLALVVLGYLTQGKELWYDNSRFNMWSWTLHFWGRQGWFSEWFGMGTGTMRTFMPIAEVEHDQSTGWYFWLHNDWLQWLPELGKVGFVANIVACLELFRRSLRWPAFAAMLAAFGAAMLTGFPLHIPVTVLLLLVITRPFLAPKELFPWRGRSFAVLTPEQFKATMKGIE